MSDSAAALRDGRAGLAEVSADFFAAAFFFSAASFSSRFISSAFLIILILLLGASSFFFGSGFGSSFFSTGVAVSVSFISFFLSRAFFSILFARSAIFSAVPATFEATSSVTSAALSSRASFLASASAFSLAILSSSFAFEILGAPTGGFAFGTGALAAGDLSEAAPCAAAGFLVAAGFFFSGSLIVAAFTVTFGSPSFLSPSLFFVLLLRAIFVSDFAFFLKIVFFTAFASISDSSSDESVTLIPMDCAFSSTSSPAIFSSSANSIIFIRTTSFML